MEIKKHLELLGLRVEDRVTGIRGVVASISFDLYGCVQAIVHPGLDKDKKPLECHYYDVSRLKVLYNQARHGSPELRFRTAGGRQTGRMRKAGNVQALNNQ